MHHGNLALSDCCLWKKSAANDGCASERVLPGQYFDGETGLNYNYQRYYDPLTDRYITSDPTGLRGGLNTYIYANANPVRFVDPEGLQAIAPTAPVAPTAPAPGGGTAPGGFDTTVPFWPQAVEDAANSYMAMMNNVIPFPKPKEKDKDCPKDPLCQNTRQAKLQEVSWSSPDHDGVPIPGLTKWQCEYTCPNGSRFTKYITNRLGCPKSLPQR